MKFISSLLSDGGKISSKRLVTLLAFVMMSVGFLANLFWDFTIDRFIYESMQWIVMIGLGTTASEKFSKYMTNKHGSKENISNEIESTVSDLGKPANESEGDTPKDANF